MESIIEKLQIIKSNIDDLEKKLGLQEKAHELRQLEASSMKGNFWQNITSATSTMERISLLKKEIEEIAQLKQRVASSIELASLPADGEVIKPDIEKETANLEKSIERFEFNL